MLPELGNKRKKQKKKKKTLVGHVMKNYTNKNAYFCRLNKSLLISENYLSISDEHIGIPLFNPV